MKRLFLATLLIASIWGVIYGASNEDFKYTVSYKWGLIQKDAGDVKISKRLGPNGYELRMVASTKPWADRIYRVRDTLISHTLRDKYRPIQYSIIANEKNRYKRDDITYTYSGNTVKGHVEKFREQKDGSITHEKLELEGAYPVYDMLSIYFYLREIDYGSLKPGETVKTTIFSGDKVEQLHVQAVGKEMVKMKDKTDKEAWHIVFKFTQQGGKKSSDDINCWISTDGTSTPLLIVGNLPIGQIRVTHEP
ncbi:MAG: DUF3108 domain-containing protein [Muribaculaceae bacterium]|nr:DUF3108 domain-containing protein [Muribaculaceae bacterium]